MSVAVQRAPVIDIPAHARLVDGPGTAARLASVTVLRPPAERSAAGPLRLTRRGVVVLASAVAVASAALVALAWLSAPRSASGAGGAAVPATVTVRAGDSLWSIAERIAPGIDPRAEVATLQRVNRVDGTRLQPGQVLDTG
jgi:nucleoid-associated protein YgaU